MTVPASDLLLFFHWFESRLRKQKLQGNSQEAESTCHVHSLHEDVRTIFGERAMSSLACTDVAALSHSRPISI